MIRYITKPKLETLNIKVSNTKQLGDRLAKISDANKHLKKSETFELNLVFGLI